jgi:hypothetical protein
MFDAKKAIKNFLSSQKRSKIINFQLVTKKTNPEEEEDKNRYLIELE